MRESGVVRDHDFTAALLTGTLNRRVPGRVFREPQDREGLISSVLLMLVLLLMIGTIDFRFPHQQIRASGKPLSIPIEHVNDAAARSRAEPRAIRI